MKWFKMHTNLHRNVKVQSLPGEVVKTWLNLLSIYGEDECFPSTQQILFETRMPEETYLSHLDTLLECGLFDSNEQGQIQPHDWHEYNPKVLSTERVQKHRASKRSKQVKRVKHVTSVSPSEKTDLVTAQENVSCVSCDVSPFLSDFQKNTQNANGTVKHVSSVSVQPTENEEVIENILESETEVKRMKHLKHPRGDKNRLEEIREDKNSLSLSLSQPNSAFSGNENGAKEKGIFQASRNGKTPEPTDQEIDEFSEWAHSVYERHPRPKNVNDVLWSLKQHFANKPEDRKLFDENYALWIEYWKLDPKYPQYVPGLADRDGRGWINDKIWRRKPPPPPSTKTKLQAADDAIYQKLLAEAEVNDKKRENKQ